MASNNLSPSNVITVSLQGTPQGLAVPNINSLALLSSESPVWGTSKDYAIYKDPTSVGQDFGTNSKAFKMAQAFFAQTPNPIATQGYLAIIPRLLNQLVKAYVTIQDVNYQAKTGGAGGNAITVAYTTGAPTSTPVISVVGNAITVQIASGLTTAQQIVDAVNADVSASALVVASVFGDATRAQTAPVLATNLANGAASATEPCQDAMVRVSNELYFFGVLIDFVPTSADALTLARYVSGVDKMVFLASNSKADFAANGAIGQLAAANLNQGRGLYYNDGVTQDTLNFAAAYASRGLSTDFTGSLTAFTMNMKQLVGFVPDTTLTQTDLNTCLATGVDIYPPFGFQGLVPTGNLYTSGANGYFDQIYNQFWLKFALQVAGFNFLAQTNTKIPQTETGMDGLKNAYRQVLRQSVVNGMSAPGAWNSPNVFGTPANLIRSVADIGFYVYSLPVTQQLPADRNARKAPLVQIAVKMAGAIHTSSVVVQINL